MVEWAKGYPLEIGVPPHKVVVRGCVVYYVGAWWLHAEQWVLAVEHRTSFRCRFAGRHPVSECHLFQGIS